ncbi:MAG: hypothetical protein MR705_00910 [Flintibacter sp.]|uniref:hypothetical protein n=1 Tax=Flintibacter sp. TaxID=1918624 RepID=UPI002672F545|nr:hypothetical protein [Flintibacter sp.]MCI6148999.1 hypothetical protein [Flintibacter sp.]MDY5037875.1 hypothetical protein [Lawsonibacter sp.]
MPSFLSRRRKVRFIQNGLSTILYSASLLLLSSAQPLRWVVRWYSGFATEIPGNRSARSWARKKQDRRSGPACSWKELLQVEESLHAGILSDPAQHPMMCFRTPWEPAVFYMLGRSEFDLRQGFARWAKHLYAP